MSIMRCRGEGEKEVAVNTIFDNIHFFLHYHRDMDTFTSQPWQAGCLCGSCANDRHLSPSTGKLCEQRGRSQLSGALCCWDNEGSYMFSHSNFRLFSYFPVNILLNKLISTI